MMLVLQQQKRKILRLNADSVLVEKRRIGGGFEA